MTEFEGGAAYNCDWQRSKKRWEAWCHPLIQDKRGTIKIKI